MRSILRAVEVSPGRSVVRAIVGKLCVWMVAGDRYLLQLFNSADLKCCKDISG
ncbi:hypothetical protein [Microcoleus sp. AT9b-C3]|uniref:hypothetical protein n=1 Tax=Microcoleus sp. AT9b-C3 TaxID=2818629 RepID=UPI002FD2C429